MRLLRGITIFSLFTIILSYYGFGQENIEQQDGVLDLWEGTWRTETLYKRAAWTPRKAKVVDTSIVESLMKGAYQQIITQDSAASTLEINRYDSKNNRYQKWIYEKDGATTMWYGHWNESTKRMIWKYVDTAAAGIEGTIEERFKSETELIVKVDLTDFKGNKLLEFKATQQRVD